MSWPRASPAPSPPTPTSVFETHSNLIERAKVCHRNITALSLDIQPDFTTSYEHIPWGEANRLMLLDHIEQAAEMSQTTPAGSAGRRTARNSLRSGKRPTRSCSSIWMRGGVMG